MKKLRFLLLFAVIIIFIGSKDASREHIAVGIFSDFGAWPTGWDDEYSHLIKYIITSLDPECKVRLFDTADLIEGITDKLDVVIFPGGSGDTQSLTMGEEGRQRIRAFVKKGGGFVGICAGAYLAQQSNKKPELSLRISSARLFNKAKYWNRGGAIAEVELTQQGRLSLPELKNKQSFFFYYYQGPLLVHMDKNNQRYVELLKYKSNIYHKQPLANGESPGKTFLLREQHGKGTVVLMAGHPEFSPGLYWLLPRMVRWAADKSVISYQKRFVSLKFHQEIMFNKTWMKWNESYANDLEMKSAPWLKIKAMRNLRNMGSFESCKYLSALLKDPSPHVRKEAALMTIDYDFFPILSDLKKAYTNEKDRGVRIYLRKAITHLTVKEHVKLKKLKIDKR